jgi:hypothetical protein
MQTRQGRWEGGGVRTRERRLGGESTEASRARSISIQDDGKRESSTTEDEKDSCSQNRNW